MRHNVIVNKISEELKSTSDDIYVDKTIKTSFKEDVENVENVEELKLKPDIVAKSGHLVNIIGIACLYDLYVESLYTKMIEKYKCFKQLLSKKGYYCNRRDYYWFTRCHSQQSTWCTIEYEYE